MSTVDQKQIELNTAAFKAAQEGKKVQYRNKGLGAWFTFDPASGGTLSWRFDLTDYRPLRESKVIYVNEYIGGAFGKGYSSREDACKYKAPNILRPGVKYVEALDE